MWKPLLPPGGRKVRPSPGRCSVFPWNLPRDIGPAGIIILPPHPALEFPHGGNQRKIVSCPKPTQKNICGSKNVSEVPTIDGKRWVILKKPKYPGVESIDKTVYSVTETVRHRSAKSAGRDVQNKLNNIAKPDNDFDIKDGDWKCDDAQVFWNGKYWLATLTWTNSPTGWNKEMYKEKQ